MVFSSAISFLLLTILFLLILRFISKTSLFFILLKSWRSITDRFYVYQYYKVPQFSENFQENQLYRKISIYLNSLSSSIEDSDCVNLFSGNKVSDIFLQLDLNQAVRDSFLGAKVTWTNDKSEKEQNSCRSFVLKIKKNDKRRVFRQYLQHILSVSDEVEQRKKDIKLHMNIEGGNESHGGRWRTIPFTHPASFDSVVMDPDLKNKVRSDLEQFLKSKQYSHRLGRVWKRSYLLYGQSGTGKTSFIAAMARFLNYDVYDIDMLKVTNDTDLKLILLQTTPKSLVVVEDLDRCLNGSKTTTITLSGVLNFMDGIVSCCGEERVMVFTMNCKEQVDQAVLRPGRIDVHIHFPLCDFSAFKTLAGSYLGVKDHKLFPQVEEIFQSGASLSPAEIGEIMISNRSSPSRALKSVINALQTNGQNVNKNGLIGLSESKSGRESRSGVFCRESIHTVREFGNLYGLLRMGSRRKEEHQILDSSASEKEGKDGSR